MGNEGPAPRTERGAGVTGTGCLLLLRFLLNAKLLPRCCWCWLCSRLIVNHHGRQGWVMQEEIEGVKEDTRWRKAIPEARDRLQSKALVIAVGILLSLETVGVLRSIWGEQNPRDH